MKQLSTYLCESLIYETFNIGAEFTEEEAYKYFQDCVSHGTDIPKEFVSYIYDIWENQFNSNPGNIPFRFSNKDVKLSRVYQVKKDDIFKILEDNGVEVIDKDFYFKAGHCTITWGEGSLRGSRSAKGLEYEDTIVAELIEMIQKIAGEHANGKRLSMDDLNRILDNKNLIHIYSIYEHGDLDEILDMYIKDPELDLTKYVKKTGSGKTTRNGDNQLFDNQFNVSVSDIEKILKESGDIIADITIDTKTPVYISVKMKASQLSGVNYQYAIAKNEVFKKAVTSNKTYDSIKDTDDMKALINFTNTLGIDTEDLFNKYVEINNGGLKDGNLKLNKNYDSRKLGCLFQKLLGGNYWYTKPSESLYVPYKDGKLSVNINSARISGTGKDFEVIGDIEGLKCSITFRTDGKGPWPYRLFPKVSVPELIELIK